MELKYVTIRVSDLDQSQSFYEEVLDLKEVKRFSPNEMMKIVFLEDSKTNTIELIEQKDTVVTHDNNATLVFETDQFDVKMDLLNQRKIPFMNGPTENYVFINDPDGLQIGLKK